MSQYSQLAKSWCKQQDFEGIAADGVPVMSARASVRLCFLKKSGVQIKFMAS